MIVCISLFILFTVVYALNEVTSLRHYQLLGELVSEVETTEKVVALTFDDGPGVNTKEVLEILEKEEILATFFLTGAEIEQYPNEALAIVEAGHEIGNHSYSHNRMVFKTPNFIQTELESTNELIRNIGYEGDIHFRPPYGKKLFLLPYYLEKIGQKTIMWNIEPETHPDVAFSSTKIVDYVTEEIEPGSIILLHVMYESRRESVNALITLIPALKNEGYTFVTVSELLDYEE